MLIFRDKCVLCVLKKVDAKVDESSSFLMKNTFDRLELPSTEESPLSATRSQELRTLTDEDYPYNLNIH
ncbi:hypothetical protein EYV94_21065 [Puteibacter caeruleilacunae]|nr:hypothetical protein EYV94_21065 [Puteibacter caeruleilacunae]